MLDTGTQLYSDVIDLYVTIISVIFAQIRIYDLDKVGHKLHLTCLLLTSTRLNVMVCWHLYCRI